MKKQQSIKGYFTKRTTAVNNSAPENIKTSLSANSTTPIIPTDETSAASASLLASQDDIEVPLSSQVQESPHTEGNIGSTNLSDISDTQQCDTSKLAKKTENQCSTIIDIGFYIHDISILTDEQKHSVLTNHFVPSPAYKLPYSVHSKKGKDEKRFLGLNHINCNEWVIYSDLKKGLFCKFCSLFAGKHAGQGKGDLKQFVTEPKIKFAKLLGKDGDFENHSSTSYHKSSLIAAKDFENNFKNPEQNVLLRVQSKSSADILKNRERLTPIIKSILFLGKQNCALRGHRDDGSLIDDSEKSDLVSQNEGNFRELLKFRIEAGDKVLEEHLKNTTANATYISKTTQNDLINCIGESIQESILVRVREAVFYGIAIDETADITHVSQLSLIINYVHGSKKYEDFLCFIDIYEEVYGSEHFDHSIEPKLTGAVLGKAIVLILQKLNLNLLFCTSISTDTCNLMSSEKCGVVSEIQKVAVNAVWDPCQAHYFNLSISKSSNIPMIRNCCNVMSEIISFFHVSGKRNFLLKNMLGSDLVSLCETRFIERFSPVDQFCTQLPKILNCLESVGTWQDSSSRSKADALLNSVDCKFIISLFVLQDIFSLALPLARALQARDLNINQCRKYVELFVQALSEKRQNADTAFLKVFQCASILLQQECIDIFIPRLAKKQTQRSNVPAENAEEYYRRSVYIPCLDSLIADMKERFSKVNTNVLSLCFLLPANIIKLSQADIEQHVNEFCTKYEILIFEQEMSKCKRSFLSEIEIWQRECKSEMLNNNNLAIEALELCSASIFPNIHKFLRIIFTSSTTTATAERSFSLLRRLKTWLRSRCRQDRLNGLALIHVHRDVFVDIEKVIDKFAASKRRRVNFVI